MYQGFIYRDVCMLFIPYLIDEYQFPNSREIEYILIISNENINLKVYFH